MSMFLFSSKSRFVAKPDLLLNHFQVFFFFLHSCVGGLKHTFLLNWVELRSFLSSTFLLNWIFYPLNITTVAILCSELKCTPSPLLLHRCTWLSTLTFLLPSKSLNKSQTPSSLLSFLSLVNSRKGFLSLLVPQLRVLSRENYQDNFSTKLDLFWLL